jgi:hypothetical protein
MPGTFNLSNSTEIRANLRAASGAYTPGAVGYQDTAVDIGTGYLKKSTSSISSADGNAFISNEYYAASAQLYNSFAHKSYRPIPNNSSVITSGSGVLYRANYGNSGLYNVTLVGGGGTGGRDESVTTYSSGGGGGGGTLCIKGLDINGLTYSVGAAGATTTVDNAHAYAGATGPTSGTGTAAGGGTATGGFAATESISGAAGGAPKASGGYYGNYGSYCTVANFTVDWYAATISSSIPAAAGNGGWYGEGLAMNLGPPNYYNFYVDGGSGGGGSAYGGGGTGSGAYNNAGTPEAIWATAGSGYGGGGGGTFLTRGPYGSGQSYTESIGCPGAIIVSWSNT